MKKNYETPVVEKIEFDYVETVKAWSCPPCGGCNNGGNGSSDTFDPFATSVHAVYGQTVYMQGHPGEPCQSSLAPDQGCGYAQGNKNHTNNVGHFC